jgi:hypothetical protein
MTTAMPETVHTAVRESDIETLNQKPEKSVTQRGEHRRSRTVSIGRFRPRVCNFILNCPKRKRRSSSSAHGAFGNRPTHFSQSALLPMMTAAMIHDAQTYSSRANGRALRRLIERIVDISEQIESQGSVTSTTVIESDESVTSATVSESKSPFDREHSNLESLQLVWLTSCSSENDNIPSIDLLRLIIDYTKIFDDCQSCLRHLHETIATTDTFFVCSVRQSQIVWDILKMKHMENMEKIYFYNSENEEFLKQEWPPECKDKVSAN